MPANLKTNSEVQVVSMNYLDGRFIPELHVQSCGLRPRGIDARLWGCQFESWQFRINIISHIDALIKPTITRVSSGFSGYI